MENASKALIIAGAILISILLISVGVLIMNSTGSTQDTVASEAEGIAKRTFNSNFTPYEGESISASQVRSLFSAIAATKGSDHVVTVDSSGEITSNNQIKSNKTYAVHANYGDDGYVSTITINEN